MAAKPRPKPARPTPKAAKPPPRSSPPMSARGAARGVITDSSKVLSTLKGGARLAPTAWAGVAIAGTAVANVPGMADAYNNWESVHSRLDTAVKSYVAVLLTKERDGWIADDREAFDDAVQRMQEALESLRAYVKNVAGIVDEMGDAYRAYWLAIAKVAVTLLALATIAAAMLATPYAANAAVNLRMLGALASQIIAVSTGALGKLLAAAAGSMSMYFSGKAWVQSFNLEPTGSARVDFTKARIDPSLLPYRTSPVAAPGQVPQPPKGGTFEWLSPRKEKPEAYR